MLVQLLGLLVEGSTLLDGAETLDLQSRAGSLACSDPWVFLSPEAGLLAHHAARLVLHDVGLLEASLGLSILPAKRWRLASLAEMTFFFMAFMAFIAAIAF